MDPEKRIVSKVYKRYSEFRVLHENVRRFYFENIYPKKKLKARKIED